MVEWCAQARADKQAFLQHGDTHRPRTRTFIIPARCHKAQGRVVFDLRPVLEAQAQGKPLIWTDEATGIETGVPIPAIADDTPITPRIGIRGTAGLPSRRRGDEVARIVVLEIPSQVPG